MTLDICERDGGGGKRRGEGEGKGGRGGGRGENGVERGKRGRGLARVGARPPPPPRKMGDFLLLLPFDLCVKLLDTFFLCGRHIGLYGGGGGLIFSLPPPCKIFDRRTCTSKLKY